jgi:hypothetical protein
LISSLGPPSNELNNVLEEYNEMTSSQKNNIHVNRNFGGAKLEKIIEEY